MPDSSPASVITRPEGPTGSLREIVMDAVERAEAQGLRPFIYFYWDDCPYCVELREMLDHPLMKRAFDGAYVVLLDATEWADEAAQTPFGFDSVPIFFRVSRNGAAIGSVGGDAWDESTPEAVAPVLHAFFQKGRPEKETSASPPDPNAEEATPRASEDAHVGDDAESGVDEPRGKGGCFGVLLFAGAVLGAAAALGSVILSA